MVCCAWQGMIQPAVPEGTQASVFAVFDDKKKLQFVGFSKDVRNSLRTVFSRRPEKAHFFKCAAAPEALRVVAALALQCIVLN